MSNSKLSFLDMTISGHKIGDLPIDGIEAIAAGKLREVAKMTGVAAQPTPTTLGDALKALIEIAAPKTQAALDEQPQKFPAEDYVGDLRALGWKFGLQFERPFMDPPRPKFEGTTIAYRDDQLAYRLACSRYPKWFSEDVTALLKAERRELPAAEVAALHAVHAR